MNTSGSVILLLALCSWALVEGFNFDRDVLSHFRSKRQATGPLKRVCAAELYSGPLTAICKTPGFLAHDLAVKKALGKLKFKSLAEGDPVCVFDSVYQENKWASTAGALDTKKIEADFVKGVINDKKNDKSWGAIVSGAIKKCGGVAAANAAAKLNSGYPTKCKTTSYVAQTCLMTEIYNACPTAARAASYNAGKTALIACDPTALFKTPADLAKAAAAGIGKFDTKLLAGQDTKSLLAKLPPGMAGMIPPGMDLKSPQAQAMMKDPSALAKLKLPANFAAMLG